MTSLPLHGDFRGQLAGEKPKFSWAIAASIFVHALVFAWLTTSVFSATKTLTVPSQQVVYLLTAPDAKTSAGGNEAGGSSLAKVEVAAVSAAQQPSNADVAKPVVTTADVHSPALSSVTAKDASVPVARAATAASPKVASAPVPAQPKAPAEPKPALPNSTPTTPGRGREGDGDGTGGSKGDGANNGTQGQKFAPGTKEMVLHNYLMEYRKAFIREVSDAKQYPEVARREGQTGRVTITLTLAKGVPGTSLKGKSEFAALDEMALKMAQKAASETPVPPILRTMDASFDVPVTFQLLD